MADLTTLRMDYFAGLDLGQAQDYSAIIVVERSLLANGEEIARSTMAGHRPSYTETRYAARHVARWPIGTTYPKVVADSADMMARPPLQVADLVVDGTGVGRAVVDLFRGAVPSSQLVPVTITAGHTATWEGGYHRVPKKDLVGVLQVLLSSRRLLIADCPERGTLLKELANFKVKQAATTGHESFESWREGDHDDLVLALALACWRGERSRPTGDDKPVVFRMGRR